MLYIPIIYRIIFSFLTSAFLCFIIIPSILKIAQIKHLFDFPDQHRKIHTSNTPTLGGLAIFAAFIFSITFWTGSYELEELQYIINTLLILFFIGLKDDLVELTAWKKLLAQILASTILVIFTEIKISSLYGFLGIYDIPPAASFIITTFFLVGITNAYNLIDGIDMLAASLGILGCTTYGIWFFRGEFYQYSLLCFSLVGALTAFLYYNKSPAKIFMGDTGSLIIGFVTGILTIKFIETNRFLPGNSFIKIYSSPAVAASVIMIPLFDTIRVFFMRLWHKKSPFAPDKTHLHHLALNCGWSHTKVTFMIFLFNLLMITLLFKVIKSKNNGELLLLALFLSYLLLVKFMNMNSHLHRKKLNS